LLTLIGADAKLFLPSALLYSGLMRTFRVIQQSESSMKRFQSIGIVYNGSLSAAWSMASAVMEKLGPKRSCWVCAAENMESITSTLGNTDLIVTVGGDGTILRAATISTSRGIPILGINMGRLGFMTELEAKDALRELPRYLESGPRVEERSMIQIQVFSGDNQKWNESVHHALNDAVIGRSKAARLITVEAQVDGGHLANYRADAVIVATATGSTAYNLSAGGPIVYPQSESIVIKPVAPHLGLTAGLVLPPTATTNLTLLSSEQAILSIDGYVDLPLASGESVRIKASSHKARFLRIHPPSHFYHTLTQRLDFGGGAGRADPAKAQV
jgi:NAD+ kinase